MILSYDNYNRLRQSRVYLANPQKSYIGVLGRVKELNLKINFNNVSEVSFKIYQNENGMINKYYDEIKETKLVEIEYIAWFQIQKVTENSDGLVPYKEINCITIENELVTKRVDDINGIFALYDITDQENSLLHIISKQCGWGIGHVDNELYSKYRTFSIDSSQIYNLLTTDISKSFDCIFQFNTYDKTINAYKADNIGDLTDIFISHKNLLKGYVRESDADNIITKLKVLGADGVDIRAVNPTGMNYISNYDYYKVPISEDGWMTDGLVDALNTYQQVYNGKMDSFNIIMDAFKMLQEELNALKTQQTDLEGLRTVQDGVIGSFVELNSGTPPIGSAEYTLYLNAVNLRDGYVTQIALKKVEISNKEVEINNVQVQLDSINFDLDSSLYFTQAQLNELKTFEREGDEYQDSTFVITDTMSDAEVTEVRLELLANGASELARVSKPQYEFEITAKNLFSIQDKDRPITYEKWRENLTVGNWITVLLRKDFWVTVRILSIEINFDNPDEMKLTLSDKTRLDDNLSKMEELLASAGKSANTLSLKVFGYDQASSITSDVREFINGTLDATLNAMQNNDNQELLIDAYGLHMRKWLEDQNKYDDHQAWWNNNVLLFSDDGFKTAKTGIGLFTTPSGEKIYSVFADVIAGQLIMGEKLAISNSSGTYTINNNGFNAVNGIYSVTINPNTPSEIFKIAVNGVKKLYVDVVNNRLVVDGYINAIGGNLGNLTVTGTLTGGTINGTTINASTIIGGLINGSNINGGTVTGAIIASSADYNGTILSTVIQDGMITTNASIIANAIIGSANAQIGSGGLNVTNSSGVSSSYGATYVNVNGEINSTNLNSANGTFGASLTLNGSSVITASNKNNYSFNPDSHHQASTTIDPVTTSAGNVGLNGRNVAWTSWVSDNFQPISSSDLRLKKNIISLDDSLDEFFYGLKMYTYCFKTDKEEKIHVGMIEQQVENHLEKNGLNNFAVVGEREVRIPDKIEIKNELNESFYVDDKVKRIEYEELIPIAIYQIQKLKIENSQLIERLEILEKTL